MRTVKCMCHSAHIKVGVVLGCLNLFFMYYVEEIVVTMILLAMSVTTAILCR